MDVWMVGEGGTVVQSIEVCPLWMTNRSLDRWRRENIRVGIQRHGNRPEWPDRRTDYFDGRQSAICLALLLESESGHEAVSYPYSCADTRLRRDISSLTTHAVIVNSRYVCNRAVYSRECVRWTDGK